MNKKTKHLEMIQNVISRMGGNLFILKGWTITLIMALLSISVKSFDMVYAFLAFAIISIFWILDGYFLSMERCYRELYDDVRLKNEKDIDFSMDYSQFMKQKNTWKKSMFSKTLLIFYGILFLAIIVVFIMVNSNGLELNLVINW